MLKLIFDANKTSSFKLRHQIGVDTLALSLNISVTELMVFLNRMHTSGEVELIPHTTTANSRGGLKLGQVRLPD